MMHYGDIHNSGLYILVVFTEMPICLGVLINRLANS